MCDIAKHPEIYSSARGVVRNFGISEKIPGYELFIRALVEYKVEGSIETEKIRNVSIPYNRDLDLSSKKRTSSIQWMTEAAKAAGIEEKGKGEKYVENVIKKMANAI